MAVQMKIKALSTIEFRFQELERGVAKRVNGMKHEQSIERISNNKNTSPFHRHGSLAGHGCESQGDVTQEKLQFLFNFLCVIYSIFVDVCWPEKIYKRNFAERLGFFLRPS